MNQIEAIIKKDCFEPNILIKADIVTILWSRVH